ncbi:MAG TPA: enoyl-CoA hydratase-related protein [Patescibacteria group bacterium]|nr:enoyl-CoA hydratase-related protein [Patescibacteria group bacterium]
MQTIQFENKGNYAIITLNRPDKLNALNAELLKELSYQLDSIKANDSIRALIITGSGQKAFAAGADIAELHRETGETGAEFAQRGHNVLLQIERLGIPVIAAVNGFALGGGCEVALACHIRFASENAKFGLPEINLGIIPGYGGTQRMTHLIGTAKALEFILTGDMITAADAERLSLVNKVVPQEELLKTAEELAGRIAAKAPIAAKAALASVRAAQELEYNDGIQFEITKFGEVCGSADFKEGTKAFLEKRTANFTGK